MRADVQVDVIVPVHNAATTVRSSVYSALHQEFPDTTQSSLLQRFLDEYYISVTVCCYDDGSKDDSLRILREIEASQSHPTKSATIPATSAIPSQLLVESSVDGIARGAGYARNRAIEKIGRAHV